MNINYFKKKSALHYLLNIKEKSMITRRLFNNGMLSFPLIGILPTVKTKEIIGKVKSNPPIYVISNQIIENRDCVINVPKECRGVYIKNSRFEKSPIKMNLTKKQMCFTYKTDLTSIQFSTPTRIVIDGKNLGDIK